MKPKDTGMRTLLRRCVFVTLLAVAAAPLLAVEPLAVSPV